MKNWNLLFFLSVCAILYFGNGEVKDIIASMSKNKDEITLMRGELKAISQALNASEKDKMTFYKLQKNNEVWQGTACASCHNTIEMALPINKRSVAEAIEIVRNGTQRSREGGMPLYTPRATRDRNSITDSELKVRFDALYTKELLEYAK